MSGKRISNSKPQTNYGGGEPEVKSDNLSSVNTSKKQTWTGTGRSKSKSKALIQEQRYLQQETYHEKLVSIVSNEPGGLNGQLYRFIEEVTMNDDDRKRRLLALNDLTKVLSIEFPQVQLHPFGSLITGLGDKDSDLDIYVDCTGNVKNGQMKVQPEQSQKRKIFSTVQSLLRRLSYSRERLFSQIIPIASARVPIIKTVHCPTRISCDLSFENFLSVRNSQLIKLFTQIDPRVRPLLCLIRYWGKFYGLTDSAKIKNYGLNLLVLVFLAKSAIVPSIYSLQNWDPKGPSCQIEDWEASFFENEFLILRHMQQVHGNYPNASCHAILELMLGFCRLYASFNASTQVVCTLTGQFLPRAHFCPGYEQELPIELDRYKEWCYNQSEGDRLRVSSQNAFIVQDPFVLNYNVSGVTSALLLRCFQLACSGTADFLSKFLASSDSQLRKAKLMDIFCPIEFPQKPRRSHAHAQNATSATLSSTEVSDDCNETEHDDLSQLLAGDKPPQRQLGFATRPTREFCKAFFNRFTSCESSMDEICLRGNTVWLQFVKEFFLNFFSRCFLLDVVITVDLLPMKKTPWLRKPKEELHHTHTSVQPAPATRKVTCSFSKARYKPRFMTTTESNSETGSSSTNVVSNGMHDKIDDEAEESDDSSLSNSTIDLISAIIENPSPRELFDSIDISTYHPQRINFQYCGFIQNVWKGRGSVLKDLKATKWQPKTTDPFEIESEITRRLIASGESESNKPIEVSFDCSVTLRPENFKEVHAEIQLREAHGLRVLPLLQAIKAVMLDTLCAFIQHSFENWTSALKSLNASVVSKIS